MHVVAISIRREGYYSFSQTSDMTKPFRATIELHGKSSKIELELSAEMSERIVAIVADEVANAGRVTAEAMTAEALTVAALPSPQAA